MRIRLIVDDEKHDDIKKHLASCGMTVDQFQFDYTLIQKDPKIKRIIGRQDEEMFLLEPNDILYFESYWPFSFTSIVIHR